MPDIALPYSSALFVCATRTLLDNQKRSYQGTLHAHDSRLITGWMRNEMREGLDYVVGLHDPSWRELWLLVLPDRARATIPLAWYCTTDAPSEGHFTGIWSPAINVHDAERLGVDAKESFGQELHDVDPTVLNYVFFTPRFRAHCDHLHRQQRTAALRVCDDFCDNYGQ